MYKIGCEGADKSEIKLPTLVGSWIKQESFRKTSISASLTMLKPVTVNYNKQRKIFKEIGVPGHLTCLLRNLYTDEEAKLELDMEQWTSSKLEKQHDKSVYCHLAYLIHMQNTQCEMLGWMNHKLESRLPREISTTSLQRHGLQPTKLLSP